MQHKNKTLGLIFLILAFLMILVYSTSYIKSLIQAKRIAKEIRITNKIPISISIPSIRVNANIESLGLTNDGTMDSPVDPNSTGWYSLGTIPGDIGSAVIDGHSGYKNNKPAIFDNLKNVLIGDKIFVKNKDGTTSTFIVRKLQNFNPDIDARDIFTSSDGLSHLNLITCTGDWNSEERTHSKRLVVFADKII